MNNERFPHSCEIFRESDVNPYEDSETGKIVLYSGKCRSYTRYVTKGSGDVITSVRTLAIPVKLIDWIVTPFTGDKVMIKFADREEHGEIVDFNPNNFGTDITWRYVRN